jgi:glycerol-3-phosphate dehydrogenase
VSVTGGKLTTYRVMARDTVDAAERSLGRTPRRARTATAPLPGAVADVVREVGAATSLTQNAGVAERLVHAHGAAWRDVWALAAADPDLASRIDESRPYLVAELLHAVRNELALTLGDLLIRRVPIAFETRDNGRAAARRVAPLVARWLLWDPARTRAAIDEYDAEVARIFTIDV